MRLLRFYIDGFKALDDLDVLMPLDVLYLIGVNGAGKSSILQALSFVHHFAAGRALDFFAERGWQPSDIRPKINLRAVRSTERTYRLPSTKNLTIALLLRSDDFDLMWELQWQYVGAQPIAEAIWIREKNAAPRILLNFIRPTRTPNSDPSDGIKIEDLKFGGSVMAVLPPERIAQGNDREVLMSLLRWAHGITSLELLSPVAMRRGVRGRPKDIGPRGERLAGFISGLSPAKKDELVSRVSQFYPISNLDAVRKTAGWIDMSMLERYPDMARVGPNHMSDGFMRILALCAIPEFEESVSLVLLDEVEDGIEPHILPRLIEFVTGASSCQFVMTSHSPLLVNYSDPQKVCLLTRAADGKTAVAKSSDMELFLKGADYFGVGEIWANASAETVAKAIAGNAATRLQRSTPSRRVDPQQVADFMDGR